jgi:molecular chaperone DnaK (HSP70)
MSTKRVYGIDLGTTYSCISYVDEHGKPVVVASSEGQQTTPSVVFFESSDNVVVGQPAKNVASLEEARVVSTIKRSMGVAGVTRMFHGKEYTPPEISSFILRKLAKDAETATGIKVEDVVITCPAYFGIAEREATKQAGIIAGFNVRYVIPEPTAAAIAYGMEQDQEQTLLVYDLGGGTFDATLIRIKVGEITVLATGGDPKLGGKDWDDAVVTHLAQTFEAETGTPYQELLKDTETYQELLLAAEKAKVDLSQAKSVACVVRFGPGRVRVDLTREKFDQITASYLQRTASLTREMIDSAQKMGVKIDRLLLVGGSTSMPQVHEWAATLPFDVQQFDPNQAVAKGAAMFGFRCVLEELIKIEIARANQTVPERINLDQVPEADKKKAEAVVAPKFGLPPSKVHSIVATTIRNVSSKSFGLVVTADDKRQSVANMVVKDDAVPREINRTFHTLEADQTGVELRVMENDLKTRDDDTVDLENCTEVLVVELPFERPLPRLSPVEVTFRLGPDGCLFVHGKDLTTNRQIDANKVINGVLKQEEVAAARGRALSIAVS